VTAHPETTRCERLKSAAARLIVQLPGSTFAISEIGIGRQLRISSGLVIVGLLLEVVSLLWFHPPSFVLFAFLAASWIGLGTLVYLVSLVFVAAPPAGNTPKRPTVVGQ
jgi:hypothetical protein